MVAVWVFLLGLGTMTAFLMAIGVTRNRILGLKAWTAVWTGASLGFAGLIAAAFLLRDPFTSEVVTGAAAGYVLSVGVHTAHHYVELRGKADSGAESPPSTAARMDPATERFRIRRRAVLVAGLLIFHSALLARSLSTGSFALAAVLLIPIAAFSVRLVRYRSRLASILATPTPGT